MQDQVSTADRIVETAARLFMQRGYRAVSINDIVRAAGVTKPTLYYHFADKEELFVQMGLRKLAELHSRMDAALVARTGAENRMRALATVLLDMREGDLQMMRREMDEHLGPEQIARLWVAYREHLFEPVRREMQTLLDEGALAPRPAAELTGLFLGLLSGFHQPAGARHGPGFSAETLVDLFLHGVGSRDDRR